jgi:hypothetical protein
MSDAFDGCMVQASVKTAAGTLINAKGHDNESFQMALAIVHDHMKTIVELEQMATAVHNVASVMPVAQVTTQPAAPAPVAAGDGWDTPAPAFAQAQVPSCKHGPRTGRNGVYKSGARAGQPYKAWFCPSPKGTPDQCSPMFLNPGTPEWDAFPA